MVCATMLMALAAVLLVTLDLAVAQKLLRAHRTVLTQPTGSARTLVKMFTLACVKMDTVVQHAPLTDDVR